MSPARPVLSVRDLDPVSAGRTRADALAEMVALARTADDAGYARYWLSEHHGSTTYLASATTILMGQVLAATERPGTWPRIWARAPPFPGGGGLGYWGARRAPTR